ncbi:MAG: acyl carrier protein [Paucibacter sp.]|nr:acyl carrier protein [Roseateles sp.]
MNADRFIVNLLNEVLHLQGRGLGFTRDTPLLHHVPELDSMAVVSLLGAIEERLGVVIDDSEISGDLFESVGSLADFVATKYSF